MVRKSLLALVSLLCLVACGSDDDNDGADGSSTVATIERAVIGTWAISTSQHVSGKGAALSVFAKWTRGTRLTFYGDHSYTDSSDGGTKHHGWQVKDAPDGSALLTLDGEGFRLDGWDDGNAVVRYPYDEGGDGDGDAWRWGWERDPEPEPAPEPKPEQPTKSNYRVCKIVQTTSGPSVYGGSITSSYLFSYDAEGRVIGYDCPQGKITFSYYSNGQMSFSSSNSGSERLATCTLDAKRRITTMDLVSYGGRSYSVYYSYDGDGRIVSMDCSEGASGDRSTSFVEFGYSGYYSFQISIYVGGFAAARQLWTQWAYHCSSEANDTNLDLNWFLTEISKSNIGYYFDYLAPLGFHGKHPHLVTREVGPDSYKWYYDNYEVLQDANGLITRITHQNLKKENAAVNSTVVTEIYYEAY